MLEELEFQYREGEIPRKDIRLIGKSTCEHFQSALALLQIHKIGYYCLFIDNLSDETRKALLTELRSRYTPDLLCPFIIFSGEEYLSGFNRDIWEARLFTPARV